MKVILNSDVLHHEGTLVRDRLMPPLVRLFEVCRDQRHEVLIPLTTRLEFDRYQAEMAERERSAITNAYAVLDLHGVTYSAIDPVKLGPAPDLLALVGKITGRVAEIAPTEEELREAHRRAALHLPPHPGGNTRSDEMRDLVIWMQAVRVAERSGGALLISRDGLHAGDMGKEEADRVKLVRIGKIDEAVEYLQVRSPAGREFESLLREVWPALVEQQPELPRRLELRSVRTATFVEGESARASIHASAANGEILTADVLVVLDGPTITEVMLENARVGNVALAPVSIHTNRTRAGGREDTKEKLTDLKEVLESQ